MIVWGKNDEITPPDVARTSPSSLYNQDLSSMDIAGGYNQEDAEGFIKINAIRLMAHRNIINRKK